MKKKHKRNVAFQNLLKSRKVTAYKLSEMLGYKERTTVYKWIYGYAEPSAAAMLKMLEILDVSALEILRIFGE